MCANIKMPRSTSNKSFVEGSDDFQKFVRSYIALKAAFTRVENQNKRLVEYAPTVASATTLDQLQKALTKLEDQYVKLESIKDNIIAVSYTHLTLPTNREV